MNLSTQSYKGARDFYPEDKRLQKYIFSIWRKVVESYGYEEYDAPILELLDLYKAKSGEELVNQQIYSFEDRGGREVAIRPEMTPTVARMVAGRRMELAYPLRWYSIPNLWRYERPQKGRLREHWQLNVDIFGVEEIDAEIELITIANDIMLAFGATEDMYSIKVNSRKLSSMIMADFLELDASASRAMISLFDRKDKIDEQAFKAEAQQIFDGDDEGLTKVASLIKAKSMADLPKKIQESSQMKHIQMLFTHLKDNRIDNAIFDVSLMRGFDYYSDIVFEVFDKHPDNNRSMFGGGRYDGLVGLFGVEPVPTVGFGMGDVTLSNFLETHKLQPSLTSETDIYLVVVGDELRQAQGVARLLRDSGINVAVDISGKKTDAQIKSALKKDVKYCMFVGEKELSSEKFPLKDLDQQKEEILDIPGIIDKLKSNKS